MTFERQNETIEASVILAEIIAGHALRLVRCRIKGTMDLCTALAEKAPEQDFAESRVITLTEKLDFNSCTFEEDVSFSGPWENTDRLCVTFEGDVQFNMSVFCGQARFIGARFNKSAGFDGCMFHRASAFQRAVFYGRTLFRTVTFEGYVLFNKAQFHEDARFVNTCFSKGVNFTETVFGRHADFAGVYSHGKTVPLIDRVRFLRKRYGDEVGFWRFTKQACQEAGLYREAGECFYNEQCAHFWQRFRGPEYHRYSSTSKILRWVAGIRLFPELVLGYLLFGYGERPIRVLVAAIGIIFLCGLFFSSNFAHFSASTGEGGRQQLTLFEGLYYSTTTFTTLGLGDIAPGYGETTLTRSVTMAEAFCGSFLTALFVVCFWKRFSRG